MNSGWLALVAESAGVREFLEIYDAKLGSLVHPGRSNVMSGIMGQPTHSASWDRQDHMLAFDTKANS